MYVCMHVCIEVITCVYIYTHTGRYQARVNAATAIYNQDTGMLITGFCKTCQSEFTTSRVTGHWTIYCGITAAESTPPAEIALVRTGMRPTVEHSKLKMKEPPPPAYNVPISACCMQTRAVELEQGRCDGCKDTRPEGMNHTLGVQVAKHRSCNYIL